MPKQNLTLRFVPDEKKCKKIPKNLKAHNGSCGIDENEEVQISRKTNKKE